MLRPVDASAEANNATQEAWRNMPDLLTGYTQFDTLTGGLLHADVLMVATSPPRDGVGLALSIALNIASDSRHRVGLFGLAMNKYQVAQCLLAMSTGIDQHRFRTGQVNAEEWQRVKEAARELSLINLWIDDLGCFSAVELRHRSRHLVEMHHVSLIVIDDLSLLQYGPAAASFENRLLEIGKVGQSLHMLARELGVPIIVCIPMAHAVASFQLKASKGIDLPSPARTKGVAHFLFLSRGDSSQIMRTGIFTIFMTQARSGLVTELMLSKRQDDHFLQ